MHLNGLFRFFKFFSFHDLAFTRASSSYLRLFMRCPFVFDFIFDSMQVKVVCGILRMKSEQKNTTTTEWQLWWHINFFCSFHIVIARASLCGLETITNSTANHAPSIVGNNHIIRKYFKIFAIAICIPFFFLLILLFLLLLLSHSSSNFSRYIPLHPPDTTCKSVFFALTPQIFANWYM